MFCLLLPRTGKVLGISEGEQYCYDLFRLRPEAFESTVSLFASNLTSIVVKRDALSCRMVNLSQLTANGDRC